MINIKIYNFHLYCLRASSLTVGHKKSGTLTRLKPQFNSGLAHRFIFTFSQQNVMDIPEIFGRAVNTSFTNINDALKILKLSQESIEKSVKTKKFLIPDNDFDIVIDYKPRIRHINLYLTQKKWSKKLLKSLKPNIVDFKSLVAYLGTVKLFGENFELRLGAFGSDSSELGSAIIKYKK